MPTHLLKEDVLDTLGGDTQLFKYQVTSISLGNTYTVFKAEQPFTLKTVDVSNQAVKGLPNPITIDIYRLENGTSLDNKVKVHSVTKTDVYNGTNTITVGFRFPADGKHYMIQDVSANLKSAYKNATPPTPQVPNVISSLQSYGDSGVKDEYPILNWNIQIEGSIASQLAQTVQVSNPKTVTKTGITEAISKLSDNTYDTLILEKGEYSASLLSGIPSNTEIIFTKGARIIPDAENEIIQITGTAPSTYHTLSADLTKGKFILSVSDTTPFKVGDWVHIRSNAVLKGINRYNNMVAEMRKIEKVNTDGTIVLNESVAYDFLVVDGAEVGIANVKENIKLTNVNIGNYGFSQLFFRGIRLDWAANIEIQSVDLIGSRDVGGVDLQARDGINVSNSYRVTIKRGNMNNIGWYGVGYVGCTQHLLVEDIHFEKCRHASSALYTDGTGGYGEPHDITFKNCKNFNSSLSGFDTHDTGKDITYINCKSFGAGDNGFQIRNDGNTKLINCEAKHSTFDGIKIDSGATSKQISKVTIDGGEYSYNGRHGIKSDAYVCNIIGKPVITDNFDSGIRTMGGTIEAELMTRNGGSNGAIRYGDLDKTFPMNWVVIKGTHFIKDGQSAVVVSALTNPEDNFKKLMLIDNIYEGYDNTGTGAVLYASYNDATSVAPFSKGNHYNTDFATHKSIVSLVGGTVTVTSNLVISWDHASYRGVNPKIILYTIVDAGSNTGVHYISDIGNGFFTISSTNPNDTSKVMWEVTY